MAVLTAQDVADLVAGTLKDLGRMSFQQIAQNLVDYEVFPQWFKKDKVVFQDGIGVQRTLMNRLPDAARHVGWTDQDAPGITDLVDQLEIPWRHINTNWSFKRQEGLMNRGKSLIFNVIEPRRAGAMINLIETLENKAWDTAPTSSDKVNPYNIQYWVVKNSGTPGFNGGAAAGNTTVAGVSLTDSPTFKNWTGQYSTNSKPDLIKKMRTMHRKIRFKSPVDSKDYAKKERYRVYCNETSISGFEDIGESQNENLGRDIASVNGEGMTFRGHPIRWVPKLDEDTSQPIYFLNHATFYPVCLKGDYLHESEPIRSNTQHDWFTVHVDLTYNYLCVDRRRNGVLYI